MYIVPKMNNKTPHYAFIYQFSKLFIYTYYIVYTIIFFIIYLSFFHILYKLYYIIFIIYLLGMLGGFSLNYSYSLIGIYSFYIY